MLEVFAVFHNTGFDHFAHQVIPFTGTFAYTGKNGYAGICLCDIVDQFLDQYGLSDTGTAEEADLAALGIGLDQIDDLDPCEQHFRAGAEVFEGRGFGVYGAAADFGHCGQSVDGIAGHVEQAAFDGVADRHGNGSISVSHGKAANQSFGTVHGDAADTVLSEVLLNFQHEGFAIGLFEFQGVIDLGEFAIKLNIDNSADDLFNLTGTCHIVE